MKTLTLLGCTCILVALSGCGSDPITLGELIEAASDADDGAPPDEAPPADEAYPPDEAPPADDAQPEPETEANNPLEQETLEILRVNCGSCHIEADLGDFSFADDIDVMIETGLIVPGNRDDSRLYTRMADQSMPPGFERRRPTPDEIELVGTFIDDLE
jgi:hypothetical protein